MSKPKTLGELQAPFELTHTKNRRTWDGVARDCEKIVKFLGKERAVDSVFKADVAALDAWMVEFGGYSDATRKGVIKTGSRWYKWMEDFEHIEFNFNPFLRYLSPKRQRLS